MNKKIIALFLMLTLLFSFSACGEYKAPKDEDNTTIDNGGNTENPDGGDEGEKPNDPDSDTDPFTATVMLDGLPYEPDMTLGETLSLKVRWTDGKNYFTEKVDEYGKAVCAGLDGDYTVTLLNLPDGYTYNPNIYKASNNSKHVYIELLKLSRVSSKTTSLYDCIEISTTGNYRAKVNTNEQGKVQEVYFQFTPAKPGIYVIESLVDVSAAMYNPIADVYQGSSQYKIYYQKLDGGGAEGTYTKNFKQEIKIAQAFIGNSYTFAVWVEGKDATFPVNVDFSITYMGSYEYDWIKSSFVYPSFIPNVEFSDWYSDYLTYLNEDIKKFGDKNFYDAAVVIDGKRVFDQQYYRLNPDDGYYHVWDEEKYAAYGGWGPILYANISIPTMFIEESFNLIESHGNKNLTLSSGTENYKLFIEGYNSLIGSDVAYFCSTDCPCYATNGGCCAIEDNCTKCNSDCRHIPKAYKYQRGYADIAVNGRCPVTEELKDFLQKYCVSQKLFSDGNGWAEQYTPRYDAYEDSQWLFACGYYSK